MYAALARGDVDAILAEVADEVDWVSVTEKGSARVAWYGKYQGKADVVSVRTSEDSEQTAEAFS